MRLLQIVKELISLSLKTKPWKRAIFTSKANAIVIRESFERLGSVFIKLGQMLALRPDFIPSVFCEEFYKLLDQVPPFPSDQAHIILRQELGNKVSEFLKFEDKPIASASFAQVHKAFLGNGEVLAVKIQRPEIDKVVRQDLIILKNLAWLFDFLFKPTNQLVRIIEEFESWTRDELDYTLEAANIEKFNEVSLLVGDGIRGPKVYKEFSTSRVLTMEYIDGHSLTQIIELVRNKHIKNVTKLGFEGKEVINKLIRNVLEMAHVYGFFHADPHPSNIIFTHGKELVFVDFGIVGTLSKRERVLLLRYLRLLLTGNADSSFEALISLCGGTLPSNIEEIRNEYRQLIAKFMETFEAKTYLEQQIRSGPVLADTLNLIHKNGIAAPISIVRYFKAFETVEGLIFALYPELQIKDMVGEFGRVSIVNIVDSLPESLAGKKVNELVLKVIDSLEKSFLLTD